MLGKIVKDAVRRFLLSSRIGKAISKSMPSVTTGEACARSKYSMDREHSYQTFVDAFGPGFGC